MPLAKSTLTIQLVTEAPVLSAAKDQITWGIDQHMLKNQENKAMLSSAHIKGKLRQAWRELRQIDTTFTVKEAHWLGKESSSGAWTPNRGHLYLSDFVATAPKSAGNNLHRIRVHSETGTANEGALLVMEMPYQIGETIEWIGQAEFVADDDGADSETEQLKKAILMGLCWTSAVGGNKNIGFGRLSKVEITSHDRAPISIAATTAAAAVDTLSIKITPQEPFVIGGVNKKNNYRESEEIISGAVLKGSLASCINMILGRDINAEIVPCDPYRELTTHFSSLRFTHAFPARQDAAARPVVIPLTTVRVRTKEDVYKYYDVALLEHPCLIHDEPPEFQIDWKGENGPNDQFGMMKPRRWTLTRTAIEQESQRSEEEKLYTYEHICPVAAGSDGPVDLAWFANIHIPDISGSEKATIIVQIQEVMEKFWQRLGKRGSRIKATVQPLVFTQSPEVGAGYTDFDQPIVICLQSDALMLDAREGAGKPDFDLELAYRNFWNKISDDSLELVRFFAAQKMVGGYLAKRYPNPWLPGPADQVKQRPYYPYYLTSSGSVFVLQAKKDASTLLNKWEKYGLDLPTWIKSKDDLWKKLPFVPQNGYGEITVNLGWHQNIPDDPSRKDICNGQ